MHFFKSLTFDFIELLNYEERPFRAKFIPAKIWDDLDKYRNKRVGLQNYFKKWKTRIVFITPKVSTNYIPVGGSYYPEEDRNELELHTGSYSSFKFTSPTWDRLKYKLIQVLMHELIHQRQYSGKCASWQPTRVRFHKTGVESVDANRYYHSMRGEIEAYAHCIYLDYKCFKPSIPIVKLIRRSSIRKDSVTFNGIIKLFGNDKRNLALPLLARKILTWERKYNRYIKYPK